MNLELSLVLKCNIWNVITIYYFHNILCSASRKCQKLLRNYIKLWLMDIRRKITAAIFNFHRLLLLHHHHYYTDS